MDDSYVKRGNSPETCEQLAAEFAGAVEPSFRRMGWHGMIPFLSCSSSSSMISDEKNTISSFSCAGSDQFRLNKIVIRLC
ncbi:hypothetical protein V6N11_073029 [Hibiscus sabdariffa]|uniref:Uncharacterized protein n=1 Tax=Hibiscus sabdariffa TaxID=183260 RepID=A0ABR2NX06_9ROSI